MKDAFILFFTLSYDIKPKIIYYNNRNILIDDKLSGSKALS